VFQQPVVQNLHHFLFPKPPSKISPELVSKKIKSAGLHRPAEKYAGDADYYRKSIAR
jgi:hypothetical protein